ncbi:aminodeoxychorismate synthase component I [Desulfuromonas acetoxidans]|uniref:aminodeoxychorismate synthase component I n=1 Tax=Desulfuromonas acetoxidans TaxID=891 RepID=UPI00293082A2|nr:aminodeoxychorismate synthase component I [Desulfuromonas acetoxidans]
MFSDGTTSQQPKVCVKDSNSGQWLSFTEVCHVVCCDAASDLVNCLRDVESWVTRGYAAAGFVGYEGGAAFYAGKQARVSPLPVAWFAISKSVVTVDGPDTVEKWPRLLWWSDNSVASYYTQLARIHQAIAQGETYQVNYTYGLHAQVDDDFDAWSFFGYLNCRHQGGYAAYLDIGSHVVCSVSPELFFAVDGQHITTRPMKGTAPRGASDEEDRRRAAELHQSEKNRAENLMIVDMLRNDLGQLATVGSVSVRDLYHLEGYPTVWQLTSKVEAQLPAGCGLVEQFKALFPCASITGAPKKKTMEWIDRLESGPRGVYTGAIGFITPQGRSQFNVAIRTAVYDRHEQHVHYGVGGGIVWDSDSADEWRETRIKASVLPGVGDFSLLETLLWRPDQGYRNLEYHLQRLEKSAQLLGIDVNRHCLRHHLVEAAAVQPPRWWRVRCLVDFLGDVSCEFIPYQHQGQTQALRLALAVTAVNSRDPWLQHKTDQRQRYEVLRNQAPGADDVLMYNECGEITETTTANVVVHYQGRWVTPPVACGLLPGTMRQRLLDEGRIVEQVVTVDEVSNCDIYLINSLRGWRWARLG